MTEEERVFFDRLTEAEYIVSLLGQVSTVSLETGEVVKSSPELKIE